VTDSSDPRSIAADEVEFRTSVLVKLAEIGRDVTHVKGTCDETKKALAEHIVHDNERFGTVTQKIGDNSSSIAKGAGICAAIVVMIGVIMYFIDKAQP
jgi:hypothetical protein